MQLLVPCTNGDLHTNGKCLLQVTNALFNKGLRHEDDTLRTASAACLDTLSPTVSAALSAALCAQLASQMGTASQPAACMKAAGAKLLEHRLAWELMVATGLAVITADVHLYALARNSPLPSQEAARNLVAAVTAQPHSLLQTAACAELLPSCPAAYNLPALLALQESKDSLLCAVCATSSCLTAPGPRLQPAMQGERSMLRTLITVAELLPQRLAAWVSAVSGEPLASVAAKVLCPEEGEVRGVEAGSVRRACAVDIPHPIEDESQAFDSAMLQGFEARFQRSPDALAAAVASPQFQALWGWSSDACTRLMGELRAACVGCEQAGQEPQGSGSHGEAQGQGHDKAEQGLDMQHGLGGERSQPASAVSPALHTGLPLVHTPTAEQLARVLDVIRGAQGSAGSRRDMW